MVICIAEDRQSEEIAVKLLLLSLTQHCPDLPIDLRFPPATAEFKTWVAKLPQVHLRTEPIPDAQDWNVKPYALLSLLQSGHSEVWWIDSDIIVTCDFRRLGKLSDATLAITEEALYGRYRDESYRARAWGFEVGRTLPFNLNTGIVRVTQHHVLLLQKWIELLENERYLKVQTLPAEQKPFHLFGDQDVLTALLASQAFSDIPLQILRRGEGIIQYFGPAGFTVSERLTALTKGLPPFIHAQRDKPWRRAITPPKWTSLRSYLDYVYLELSPYNAVAARYRPLLNESLDWLLPRSNLSRLLALLGFGNPALTGLPIALIYSLIRFYKTLVGMDDRFDPQAAYFKLKNHESHASALGMQPIEP